MSVIGQEAGIEHSSMRGYRHGTTWSDDWDACTRLRERPADSYGSVMCLG
ncbi:hypothetical protein ACFV85_23285 [Streptomyces niveus]